MRDETFNLSEPAERLRPITVAAFVNFRPYFFHGNACVPDFILALFARHPASIEILSSNLTDDASILLRELGRSNLIGPVINVVSSLDSHSQVIELRLSNINNKCTIRFTDISRVFKAERNDILDYIGLQPISAPHFSFTDSDKLAADIPKLDSRAQDSCLREAEITSLFYYRAIKTLAPFCENYFKRGYPISSSQVALAIYRQLLRRSWEEGSRTGEFQKYYEREVMMGRQKSTYGNRSTFYCSHPPGENRRLRDTM
jgi:hypothetical protein